MIRIWAIAMLCAMLADVAIAQTVFNPNSPRGRRELRVNPPAPAAPAGQVGETIEAERWGTTAKPLGQPQWGTLGETGWLGVGAQPPAPR